MIDTDKYDNEGIELSDGGTICFPEDDGRIHRIDKDGNTMQTLHPEDTEWQEWYELFDTLKDLIAEIKRLRKAIIEVAFDKHESVYEMKQALVEMIE
jgi:hypothetical protein